MTEPPKIQPQKPLQNAAQPTTEAKIDPPREYGSARDLIKVTIDHDEVSIDIAGPIAEDIGCYRRIEKVVVKFKKGLPPSIIPVVGP